MSSSSLPDCRSLAFLFTRRDLVSCSWGTAGCALGDELSPERGLADLSFGDLVLAVPLLVCWTAPLEVLSLSLWIGDLDETMGD